MKTKQEEQIENDADKKAYDGHVEFHIAELKSEIYRTGEYEARGVQNRAMYVIALSLHELVKLMRDK